MTPPTTITLPNLFDAQAAIVNHPARFKVLSCGRRFGKTSIAAYLVMTELLSGHRAAYFAPSQIMSLEVFASVKSALYPLIRRVSEIDNRIEFINDAVFECWTTRTENVRGRKYHFAVIDEAAFIPSVLTWQAVIRPLLTDYRGGALFASTPNGRNWFWELYRLGLDPAILEWQSWTFPTTANPYIDPAEVAEAAAHLPQRIYQQEYLAVFLEDGGSVFRGLDRVCTADPIWDADPAEQYVFGIDWGRDNDFTAVSVMTRHGHQVYLDRFNQISYTIQRDRLKDLIARYRPVKILAESNSIGSVNIDALISEGIRVHPFTTTSASKAPLIDHLAHAIEQEQVTLLNDAILTTELQAYRMSRAPSGIWQYSAPPGGHDDTVIATALSWEAARTINSSNIDWV